MSDLPVSTREATTHGINRIVRNSADWYKRSRCNDRVRECADGDMPELTLIPLF